MTLCYYHGGAPLNTMKICCPYIQPMCSHLITKPFDNVPLGGCPEGLDAFVVFFKNVQSPYSASFSNFKILQKNSQEPKPKSEQRRNQRATSADDRIDSTLRKTKQFGRK